MSDVDRRSMDPTEVAAYDLGRVRYFMQCMERGEWIDPISVESKVFSMSISAPPVWGGPIIDDGHHRFAAAVLSCQETIPMSFGGLVTTCNWLVGRSQTKPQEIE